MKHKLEDGRVVVVVPLSAKIPAKWLLDYINGLSKKTDTCNMINRST